MEWSAGVYRNHIKGDLILNNFTEVHFGLGNSQIGISSTATLNYDIFQGLKIGCFVQVGVGPHFTRWQNQNEEHRITLGGWGIRGKGAMINAAVQITSPTFWNRWSIHGYLLLNQTYSTYQDITYEPLPARPVYLFEDIHFTLINKNLIAALGLSFDIFKNK